MALAKYFEEIMERYLEGYNSLSSELWPSKEEREGSENQWKNFKQDQFERAQALLKQSKAIFDEFLDALTDPMNGSLYDSLEKADAFRQRDAKQKEIDDLSFESKKREALIQGLNSECNELQRQVDRLTEENNKLKGMVKKGVKN